jgi:hypothetical protein
MTHDPNEGNGAGNACPERPFGGVFHQEYMGRPCEPSDAEIRMRELAEEYHRICDAYDRGVCTGGVADVLMFPATGAEALSINRHALGVRETLWRKVAPLGFSRRAWLDAISDAANRYRY